MKNLLVVLLVAMSFSSFAQAGEPGFTGNLVKGKPDFVQPVEAKLNVAGFTGAHFDKAHFSAEPASGRLELSVNNKGVRTLSVSVMGAPCSADVKPCLVMGAPSFYVNMVIQSVTVDACGSTIYKGVRDNRLANGNSLLEITLVDHSTMICEILLKTEQMVEVEYYTLHEFVGQADKEASSTLYFSPLYAPKKPTLF